MIHGTETLGEMTLARLSHLGSGGNTIKLNNPFRIYGFNIYLLLENFRYELFGTRLPTAGAEKRYIGFSVKRFE